MKDDARAGEVISRLRALKKTNAEFEPLDLNSILGEVIALLHSDLVIRDIKVVAELDPRLPLVRDDRIQRIGHGVIHQSIDHQPSSGPDLG